MGNVKASDTNMRSVPPLMLQTHVHHRMLNCRCISTSELTQLKQKRTPQWQLQDLTKVIRLYNFVKNAVRKKSSLTVIFDGILRA